MKYSEMKTEYCRIMGRMEASVKESISELDDLVLNYKDKEWCDKWEKSRAYQEDGHLAATAGMTSPLYPF